MTDTLDDRRANDARVRVELDPLLAELSPAGKVELATRLLLDGARGFVSERLVVPDALAPARSELVARATSSATERDGAPGEEAHAGTVSAVPDVTHESQEENHLGN